MCWIRHEWRKTSCSTADKELPGGQDAGGRTRTRTHFARRSRTLSRWWSAYTCLSWAAMVRLLSAAFCFTRASPSFLLSRSFCSWRSFSNSFALAAISFACAYLAMKSTNTDECGESGGGACMTLMPCMDDHRPSHPYMCLVGENRLFTWIM